MEMSSTLIAVDKSLAQTHGAGFCMIPLSFPAYSTSSAAKCAPAQESYNICNMNEGSALLYCIGEDAWHAERIAAEFDAKVLMPCMQTIIQKTIGAV